MFRKGLFPCFILLRVVMAMISCTWHLPDETWQSVEISHRIVFGYGYQTWEWHYAIRSFIHPLLFVPGLVLLKLLSLDGPEWVVLVPRLTQAFISAIGDVCIVNFCARHFGAKAKDWFLLFYGTHFFVNYCSSRTLINSLEMALTSMALQYYPDSMQRRRESNYQYIALITLSFLLRATTAIFWLPLVLIHLARLAKEERLSTLFRQMIPAALIVIMIVTLMDSIIYGQFVCVPWNFFLVNILHDVGSLYGVNPWHWYVTNALPVLLAVLGAGPFLESCFWSRFSDAGVGLFAKTIAWTMIVYSCIPHKEMRFLLPIVPLACCFVADFLGRKEEIWNRIASKKVIIMTLLVLNVPATLYLSLVHQRGVTSVISHLSATAQDNSNLLFLMPCHSTPYFSHLHRNLSSRFLTCEPNLDELTKNADEADEFYREPMEWLDREYPDTSSSHLPSHVVLYDVLVDKVKPFLSRTGLKECADFFHSHFPDGRIGYKVNIFCKSV